MPEEPAATAVATAPAPEPTPPAPEAKPKDDPPLGESGEKALEAFKQRARDAEKRAKELEGRVKEFEDRDKSETEKLSGKVESLTGDKKTLEAQNLRLRVALEKKLPAELIDRLKGDSKEEIETDAEQLLKLVKPAETTDFDGGARTPAPEQKKPEEAHNDFLLGVLAGKDPT